MKVVILMREDTLPIVAQEPDDTIIAMVSRFAGQEFGDIEEVRSYLEGLPRPCGLFENMTGARLAIAELKRPGVTFTGRQVREARKALGVSAVAFGRMLGYQGKNNGVNNQVFRLEKGERTLSPDRADLLSALLSERGLDKLDEEVD